MEENNFSYKWKKLFAAKRFGKKSGNVILTPLEQQELLDDSEKESGRVHQEPKPAKVKYPIGAYAPGYYTNKCATCQERFTGDKYSRQCEPCAINTVNESNKQALYELQKLKDALRKIKFSNDAINKLIH